MREYADAHYDALEALPSCCVCQDQGCEFCAAVEEFPDDAFELFTIQDLQRLQRDAKKEVSRRLAAN